MDEVVVGDTLRVEDVVRVARRGARVTLDPQAIRRMEAGRAVIERRRDDLEPAYGINTGFGALAEVRVRPEDLDALQLNLVRSHASGVGDPLPTEVVRAAMLLRAAVFATGRSGVRPDLARLLVDLLNAGIHPIVPSRGSVGASVAAASLVAENRVLCHPASVDSIPSSANREDHVSMGMTAALKARSVVANTRAVLAIEALCAAAGLDQRRPARPGRGVRAAHEAIRTRVPPLDADRPPAPDIEEVARLLASERGLVEAALDACGGKPLFSHTA